MSLLQKVKRELGNTEWHVTTFDIHLHRPLHNVPTWTRRNNLKTDQADWQAKQASQASWVSKIWSVEELEIYDGQEAEDAWRRKA